MWEKVGKISGKTKHEQLTAGARNVESSITSHWFKNKTVLNCVNKFVLYDLVK